MRKFYILSITIFYSLLGFSQSAKIVKGKIVSENSSISNAEVINVRTKTVVVSNEFGEFSIPAQRNDLLVIVAKDCFEKKVYMSSILLSQDKISIEVIRKANELKEVVIRKEEFVTPADIASTASVNKYNTMIRANQTGVYTGETVNGTDFIAVGKMIGKLFKRKRKEAATINVDIKDYLSSNFDEAFCAKVLYLKQEQVIDFFKFCEDDPKAQRILNDGSDFEIVDFLISKKEKFNKR
jgi:hypothetical protein